MTKTQFVKSLKDLSVSEAKIEAIVEAVTPNDYDKTAKQIAEASDPNAEAEAVIAVYSNKGSNDGSSVVNAVTDVIPFEAFGEILSVVFRAKRKDVSLRDSDSNTDWDNSHFKMTVAVDWSEEENHHKSIVLIAGFNKMVREVLGNDTKGTDAELRSRIIERASYRRAQISYTAFEPGIKYVRPDGSAKEVRKIERHVESCDIVLDRDEVRQPKPVAVSTE